MSPDPMNAGAVLTDPQSWNGYSYVRNSPMGLVDPSGMDAYSGGGGSCADDPICSYEYESFFPPWIDLPNAPPFIEVRKEPVPPGSFPGGESLGLPPGLSIPGPFGIPGDDCEFGPCGFKAGIGPTLNTQQAAQLEAALAALAADFWRGIKISINGRGAPGDIYETRLFGTHHCGSGGAGQQ
jgi:hypothetical protein